MLVEILWAIFILVANVSGRFLVSNDNNNKMVEKPNI